MWSSFLVILEDSSSEFIVFVIKGIVILELRYKYIISEHRVLWDLRNSLFIHLFLPAKASGFQIQIFFLFIFSH